MCGDPSECLHVFAASIGDSMDDSFNLPFLSMIQLKLSVYTVSGLALGNQEVQVPPCGPSRLQKEGQNSGCIIYYIVHDTR